MKFKTRAMSSLPLLLALVLGLGVVLIAAGPARIRDFKQLLETARQLQSAEALLSKKSDEFTSKREDLLASFARETKSTQCNRHYEQLIKVVNEYRIKAYNYIADSKKSNNWFGWVAKLGGPLQGMKGLSKFDANLNSITERYESQSKNGLLNETDVDCDMLKFQIKVLDELMFVLQTDIKTLITENPQILNQNIKMQLGQDKFVSTNNFHDTERLTPKQSELLLNYYVSRVDADKVTIQEALRHFHNPGSLIIGRLLDSCHAINRYTTTWRDNESARQATCSQSKSDPQNELFANRHKIEKFDDVANFCANFFEAL